MKDEKGFKYLSFSEDLKSKTNQGGIATKNFRPRHLNVYGNRFNSDRDVVRLYEKYIGLLPDSPKCSALYKYGLCCSSMKPKCWFSDKPVGINSLKKVVNSLMRQAGIDGRFTNHSLHATTATRMFEKGVDEQLIKCVTGHKSDAVRLYKRPSDKLIQGACGKVVEKEESRHVKSVKTSDRTVEYNKPEMYVPPPDFDIDSYEIRPEDKVTYRAKFCESEPVKSHKRDCPFVDSKGNCTDICSVLKKIDAKSTMKKVKKLKVSLEFDE